MKRACPYDINLERMSKKHLMDYDVDSSVLQKIHEDTVQKLMHGARDRSKTSIIRPVTAQTVITSKPADHKPLRQMEVTSYFSQACATMPLAGNHEIRRALVEEGDACFYCDKRGSTSLCGGCSEHFCSSCCLAKYGIADEEYICLSCS